MPGAEPTGRLVVDASVAVRWLVVERGAEAARRLLLERRQWMAPRLLLVEVAATLRRKAVEQVITAEEAERSLVLLLALIEEGLLTLARDEALVGSALRIALRSGHKLPDCLYLALAERERAALVTVDRQLERLARTQAIDVIAVATS